ncbi:MAG TPA: hypothetical protein VG075_16115 [Candidatus Acidoferrum sp.]|jgi:hypothetical protein|nr:hypothetical protein [Candidatus Acidoferrum sp.]
MSSANSPTQTKSAPRFSLDAWAVLIALAAAVLIRVGLIHRIPW